MELYPDRQDFTTHTRTHTPHTVTHAHTRTLSHVIEHSKPDVTLMDRNQSLARTRSLTNLTSDLQERVSDRSSYVATARNGKTAEAKCTPKKGRRGSISTLLSAQEWSNLTEGVRTKTKRYEEEQAGRLLIKLVMPA